MRDDPRLDQRLLTALLDGDSAAADRVVTDALDAGLAPVDVHALVVTPAMHEVGRLWETARITIADEHLATATCHRVLASLYPHLLGDRFELRRERILLAGLEPERHDLGLRTVADVLEGAGFDVRALGGGLPLASLLDAIARHAPDAVGLSGTMAHVPLAEAVAAIRRAHPGLPIVAGGAATSTLRGVETVTDVRSAVRAFASALSTPLTHRAAARPAALPSPVPVRDSSPEAKLTAVSAALADSVRAHARESRGLRAAALRDPLTQLWNRRAFDERLATAVEEGGASLLLVDVDFFKQVNDGGGHGAGDALLRAVASAISAAVRGPDFCARIGGDEFAVVLPGCESRTARVVAERIRAAAEGTGCTVSIGISSTVEARSTALDAADEALYAAKHAGRNAIAGG